MSTKLKSQESSRAFSLKVSQRLQALADFVPSGTKRLLDVGCDHASVPLELLAQASVNEVLLLDINAGPLERARERSQTLFPGGSEKINFLQTDGLEGVDCRPDDIVLISGMGGEAIARILENAYGGTSCRPARLILQPQTKQYELRSSLQKLSLSLSHECLVWDSERFYTIIVCDNTNDEPPSYSQLELYVGPQLILAVQESLHRPEISEEDELVLDWAARLKQRLELEGRGDVWRARLAVEWTELLERGYDD